MSEFWCGRQAAAAAVVASSSSPPPSSSSAPLSKRKSTQSDFDDGEKHEMPKSFAPSFSSARLRDDRHDPYDPGPGCRPCCSHPHGTAGWRSAILSVIGFALAFAVVTGCNYLSANFTYCVPPRSPPTEGEEFGTCGDCHCIPDEIPGSETGEEREECPHENKPDMEFDPDMVRRYESSECVNPMSLGCDPYTNSSCVTSPPQDPDMVARGEDAECAVKYLDFIDNLPATFQNDTNITDPPPEPTCPAVARYELVTYPSPGMAAEDGAFITHRGACGVCSTLQDLAAYIEHTDLVDKGTECSFRAMRRFEDGVRCYMEVGFTEPCSVMWVYNGFQTKSRCWHVCGAFTVSGKPNNGPPPQCELARCLECDEVAAGPEFAAVAARSRRRSGLLSMIARPCSALLDVRHVDPCDVANNRTTALSSSMGEGEGGASTREEASGPVSDFNANRKCFNHTDDLGLFYYSGVKSGGGLLSRINPFTNIFSNEEDQYMRSLYGTCYKYNFSSVTQGLWADLKDLFGGAFTAASAFGVLGLLLGFVSMIVACLACCVAFRRRTWIALCVCGAAASLFMLLTLVFFASDVCMYGCAVRPGAILAIISGCCFAASSGLCLLARPYDKRMRAIQCCCCPSGTDDEFSGGITEVTIRRTVARDGSVTTERITTHPSGFRNVERTVELAERRWEDDEDGGRGAQLAATGAEEAVEKEPLLSKPSQPSEDGAAENGAAEDSREAAPENEEVIA